jgi:hypothetical protein
VIKHFKFILLKVDIKKLRCRFLSFHLLNFLLDELFSKLIPLQRKQDCPTKKVSFGNFKRLKIGRSYRLLLLVLCEATLLRLQRKIMLQPCWEKSSRLKNLFQELYIFRRQIFLATILLLMIGQEFVIRKILNLFLRLLLSIVDAITNQIYGFKGGVSFHIIFLRRCSL